MNTIKTEVFKKWRDEYTKDELVLGLIAQTANGKEQEIEIAWLNECIDILTGGDFEKGEETKLFQEMRNAQNATHAQYYTDK